MARVWEKFTGGPVERSRERLHITLDKKGVFLFNRKVFEALGSPRAVVLYFEKEASVIGISAAHPKLREAFPVKVKADGSNWIVNAIPFCRHFGIKPDKTEAFVNPDIDDSEILQLDLRTTRHAFGGKQPGQKRKKAAQDSK